LWDRRTGLRHKLVKVPSEIAELVEETEFEGLSDMDYEAGGELGLASQSDQDREKQSEAQELVSAL